MVDVPTRYMIEPHSFDHSEHTMVMESELAWQKHVFWKSPRLTVDKYGFKVLRLRPGVR